VEQSGNVKIITFTGAVAPEIEDRLAAELAGRMEAPEGGHLLLDFSNVDRINSEELGTLIRVHRGLAATGGRLTLFNLRPEVYEVFTVTHLHTLLGICRESASLPFSMQDEGAPMPAKMKVSPVPLPLPPAEPPITTAERLRAIELMRDRVNGYVGFICQVENLKGSSVEAKEKAVAAFYERMAVLERQLNRIHEEIQLA